MIILIKGEVMKTKRIVGLIAVMITLSGCVATPYDTYPQPVSTVPLAQNPVFVQSNGNPVVVPNYVDAAPAPAYVVPAPVYVPPPRPLVFPLYHHRTWHHHYRHRYYQRPHYHRPGHHHHRPGGHHHRPSRR